MTFNKNVPVAKNSYLQGAIPIPTKKSQSAGGTKIAGGIKIPNLNIVSKNNNKCVGGGPVK